MGKVQIRGEMFHAHDPATKEAATRNPFWKPKEGTYNVPGFGVINIGINELQASGVMFGVCDAALTVYSAAAAQKLGKEPAEIKKELGCRSVAGNSTCTVRRMGCWSRTGKRMCIYFRQLSLNSKGNPCAYFL